MSNLFSIDGWDFFPINQLISCFQSIYFLLLALCSFKFNLQSKFSYDDLVNIESREVAFPEGKHHVG